MGASNKLDEFLELAMLLREPGIQRVQGDPRVQKEDAIRESLKRKWANKNELRLARGRAGWWRLLGLRSCFDSRWRPIVLENLPGDDHCSLWLRNGEPAVWVSQPYPLSSSKIGQMTYVAEQYGLSFEISTWPAWHYPGSVLFVEWKLVARPVRLPDVQDIVAAVGHRGSI